jgi:hypothetical protein
MAVFERVRREEGGAPHSPIVAAPPHRGADTGRIGSEWRRVGLEALVLLAFALLLRVGAAWILGEGAPFGPDGTGVEAAVHLGGHLYPLHPPLIQIAGSARNLSIISGSLACIWLLLLAWRLELGRGAGWALACFPNGVYTSALSAGDSPALSWTLLGILLSTGRHWGLGFAGGLFAATGMLVKPIALPALVLLAHRRIAMLGGILGLIVWGNWLQPLWRPRPAGGLLGTWWLARGGHPPNGPGDLISLAQGGISTIADALLGGSSGTPEVVWGLWVVPLAALGATLRGRRDLPDPTLERRLLVLPALGGLWFVAALFGDRVEGRYLLPSLIALLPFAMRVVPPGVEAVALWPAAALLTQVAAYRAVADPHAEVPGLPVVEVPQVDARTLFDEASTEDATGLREEAARLAESLPFGATHTVERRAHGREGELVWPLRVARPDVVVRTR